MSQTWDLTVLQVGQTWYLTTIDTLPSNVAVGAGNNLSQGIAEISVANVPNNPGILFPIPAGLTITGVTTDTAVFIPMTLTSYSTPFRKPKLGIGTTIPIIEGQLAYGGSFVMEGAQELPKLSVEGFMDTPLTVTGSTANLALTVNSMQMTYADLIALYIEGRATNPRSLVQPLMFRDPYGRTHNSPMITNFTASHVEAVPGRTNFQLELAL